MNRLTADPRAAALVTLRVVINDETTTVREVFGVQPASLQPWTHADDYAMRVERARMGS